MIENNAQQFSLHLSNLAVKALIEEAELTPKPGLVDKKDSGTHTDMTLDLMIKSAYGLSSTFRSIAEASYKEKPSLSLREKIAAIGRSGEATMFKTTGGINTHKGAIWALGLLVSSAAMHRNDTMETIVHSAGRLARFHDRHQPKIQTNGLRVNEKYGVLGAKGEALLGFPHIREFSFPILHDSRTKGISEDLSRLNALLSLMANIDDTCILHRGGMDALYHTKQQAKEILERGLEWDAGHWVILEKLDHTLHLFNASPGGSADLLAATLFLDYLYQEKTIRYEKKSIGGNPIGSLNL
ncbi:triphosphoribosyl-dephospho-CoA synthase [Bacillus pakistanensis]|uniref:triphosphoribosyl-dephospho-CoA synthase n=1 Tax=Rossellomorea pakistanensis TaxID=992288 RepID=A0ABS2NC45_9BACI|nr:triphosphoribosyl-dephospho-CoA synthase [Bacillus pakistanensis]MBM7585385.1 triphosphoribosyl-dephospho-CoA synthase [Bacillus pakistanensis]